MCQNPGESVTAIQSPNAAHGLHITVGMPRSPLILEGVHTTRLVIRHGLNCFRLPSLHLPKLL